jgi:hypothetical protein
MKKSLLFAAALSLAISASAQVARNHGEVAKVNAATEKLTDAKIGHRTAQQFTGKMTKSTRPKHAAPANSAYYLRPKGTMYVNMDKNGSGYGMPFIHSKPYDAVTFRNMSTLNGTPAWGYKIYSVELGDRDSLVSNDYDLTVRYGYEYEECPELTVGSSTPFGLSNGMAVVPNSNEVVASSHSTSLLASAHWYGPYDRWGVDQTYWFMSYSGAKGPDGDEDSSGQWFGKNYSGWNVLGGGFDKPISPYVLNKVYFRVGKLKVTENVDLECRVYRLRDLPEYQATSSVRIDPDYQLTENALVATGHATLTTDMNEAGGALLEFVLKETDPVLGIQYETTPEIEDAIVVVILGMDDPRITTITGFITNDEEDEGVGEITYMGHQENGVITELRGLNNFFAGDVQGSGMELKAGASIFLDVTRPFLTYNYTFEEGVYEFPAAGGQLAYDLGSEVLQGVSVYSTSPKADWMVYTADYEDVPDWLHITLTDDMENGEWAQTVTIGVTADALPSGMTGREAVVRFAINGAYLDYKFIQGSNVPEFTFSPEGTTFTDPLAVNVSASNMPAGATMQVRFDEFYGEMGEWMDGNTYTVEATGDLYARVIAADGSVIATSEPQKYDYVAPEPVEPEFPEGDVTGDNKVDVEDVNAVINIILKVKTAEDYPGIADVTGDGKIDVEDVNAIINIVLKV